MPFVPPQSQHSAYDVIVVGSGAGGGQSAYTLCMDGAKVLMLEAGREYSPQTETPMFQTPDLAPLAGTSTPQKPFGFYDATVDGGWEVPGEPYVSANEEPGRRFEWWRGGRAGGRPSPTGGAPGAHLAAQRSLRLQASQPRRAGFRLADQLLRPCAVLRQG